MDMVQHSCGLAARTAFQARAGSKYLLNIILMIIIVLIHVNIFIYFSEGSDD